VGSGLSSQFYPPRGDLALTTYCQPGIIGILNGQWAKGEELVPLNGYMKTSDPGRISTITVAGGVKGFTRHKKLFPTKYDSKQGRTFMYVRDCEEHDVQQAPGGVIPVELFTYVDGKQQSQGIAKCCVFCWLILVPPTPEFPAPQPLPTGKAATSEDSGLKTRGKDLKPRTRTETVAVIKAAELIKRVLSDDPSQSYPVVELVSLTSLPRATLNRLLGKMEEKGYIQKEIEVAPNGRKRIVYFSTE